MKVIDLLNKIANGEEVPKKIKYHNRIYIKRSDCYNYILENGGFDDELKVIVGCLTDEVEIIEEDKSIEPILIWKEGKDLMTKGTEGRDIVIGELGKIIIPKINEIIDYLEEKEWN